MILVVGSPGSGASDWVCEHLGYTDAQVSDDPSADAPVLASLHNLLLDLDRDPDDRLLDRLLDHEVIICDEVGRSLLPADAAGRAWHERVGRTCQHLAPHASAVVRVEDGRHMLVAGTLPRLFVELYRHGATPGNLRGAYVGLVDEPVDESWAAGALPIDDLESTVFVTRLSRTQMTARIFFPRARQVVVDGLEEMDFGEFDTRTAAELEGCRAYRSWVDSMCEDPCPGGESLQAFERRCADAFARLVADAIARGETLLRLVVHGGTIMSLMDTFARPEVGYFDCLTTPGGCWTVAIDTHRWPDGGFRIVDDSGSAGRAALVDDPKEATR